MLLESTIVLALSLAGFQGPAPMFSPAEKAEVTRYWSAPGRAAAVLPPNFRP